jgi:4-carboxymuconolactone decarboxylase
LERGTSPNALYEVLLQTYLFAGYPRAINALAELAALGGGADGGGRVDLDADAGQDVVWRRRGGELCRRVYGTAYEALLATMGRISPDLARWMVVEGYGKVLSRPGLDAITRELTAVAALLVLSVPDQLRAHLRGALLVGASPAAVESTLRTAALLDAAPLPGALHLLEDVRTRVESPGSG